MEFAEACNRLSILCTSIKYLQLLHISGKVEHSSFLFELSCY